MHRPAAAAMTLVELLIAVSIVAILVGMAMPMVTMASKGARKASTQAILRKVETALGLFKAEVKVNPFQAESAAAGDGDDLVPGRGNRLHLHLGRDLDDQGRVDLNDDITAIDARFTYNVKKAANPHYAADESYNPIPTTAFKKADVVPRGWTQWNPATKRLEISRTSINGIDNPIGSAMYLNRIAGERFRLAVLAGHVEVPGWKAPTIWDPTGTYPAEFPGGKRTGRDLSGTPLISSPKSKGWRSNYLAGEMEKRYISGDDILDAYGRALVYICPVLPGVATTNSWANIGGQGTNQGLREADYGLDAEGRRSRDRLDVRHHNGTDYALPADPAASDRRYFTAPGLEFAPELWSAGEDGRLCGQRSHGMNKDNVAATVYDRNLQP